MPKAVPLPKRTRSTRSAVALDLDSAWSLYDKQAQFVRNTAMFSIFLGGVGSGKSHGLTGWVVARALQNPGSVGALLGRTSIDLQTVLLPSLFDRLQECQDACGYSLIADYDKGGATLKLVNGTRIYFRPFNRIAKVRSLTLTFAAADEVEWSEANPDEIWTVFTGRLRGHGPVPGLAFATSPNGLRGITKRFVDAQRQYLDARNKGDAAGVDQWRRWHVTTATSFDNPHNPPHFFDSLRTMSRRRYEQEVRGKVLQPLHTVYQLEARHVVDWSWKAHLELPRVYGIDWGTNSHHVAVMAQVRPDGVWIFADELVCDDMPRGTFQERLRAWVDGHGRQVPALFAVDRAVPVENQALAARYRMSPVRWMESKEDQLVTTGIELIRDCMDPFDGEPQIVFARSLPTLVSGQTAGIVPALRGYCYHVDNDGQPTTKPKKDNVFDHACDAVRYIVSAGADMPDLHNGRRLAYNRNAPRPAAAASVGRSGRQV